MVKFLDYDCILEFAEYVKSKRVRILLRDSEDGAPIAVATVNVPEHKLNENEVIIKSYSENIGLYEALLEADIVKTAEYKISVGFEYAHVCELTDKTLKNIKSCM